MKNLPVWDITNDRILNKKHHTNTRYSRLIKRIGLRICRNFFFRHKECEKSPKPTDTYQDKKKCLIEQYITIITIYNCL